MTDVTEVPRSDQRTLRDLHDQLRTACAALVDPTAFDDEQDDGRVIVREGDSLLAQLQEAVGSGSGRPGSRGKSTPMPIDPGAVDLLTEIDGCTAEWNSEVTVEARIRLGVNLAGQWTAEADVQWVLGRLERWVGQIDELFNPPRKYHLAAPCPACGKRMAWRVDESTGEKVQQPALDLQQVGEGNERSWECSCLACKTRWPAARLEHLAMVVEQERAEAQSKAAGEPLALWKDGSVHRLNPAGSNMARPVPSLEDTPEGGSAA